MDLETVTYRQSDALEALLVTYGYALCNGVREASRVDELDILNELIIEYGTFASAYSRSTERFREDLGVSLNEAALMKRAAIAKHTNSREWEQFYEETLAILGTLRK